MTLKPGDRVRVSSMGGGLGTVGAVGVPWQGRNDGIRVKRDGEQEGAEGLLFWPHEVTPVAARPAGDCHGIGRTGCGQCEACSPRPSPTPIPPDANAYWWARRWIEKATPDELAAMRVLLAEVPA